MKNVITKLSNLFPQADKVLHFIAGVIIAVIILFVFNEPWTGFAGAMAAGFYKEFVDHIIQDAISKKYAISSYLDWFSTILGGLFIELIW